MISWSRKANPAVSGHKFIALRIQNDPPGQGRKDTLSGIGSNTAVRKHPRESQALLFFCRIQLLDYNHPAGVGEIAGSQFVEIETGGDTGSIPENRSASCLLFAVHQRRHLLAEEVVNL